MAIPIRLKSIDRRDGGDSNGGVDLEVELMDESGELYMISSYGSTLSVPETIQEAVDEARRQVGNDDLEQNDWRGL